MEDNEENRRTHLGQIQLVIIRMAANSFLLKGWAVTLVAALFALASVNSREQFVYVALLPAVIFWGLDAYYLRQERLFRKLYDVVRNAPIGSLTGDVYSMNTKPYDRWVDSLVETSRSFTLMLFHGAVVAAVIIGIIVISTHGGGTTANGNP